MEAQLKRLQRGTVLANWARGCYYDVLANTVAVFSPCPENLPKTKSKSITLISLLGAIFRQPNINYVVWLLVITHIHVYNGKEQVGQKEIQNVH